MVGVMLIITAGCEQMELKWHGAMYAMCVIVTDMAAGCILAGTLVLAVTAAAMANLTCDPESFMAVLEDAGADSTNSDQDAAAAVTMFYLEVFLKLIQGTCELKSPLHLYIATVAIGMFGSCVSFLASLCVCMKCSDDGADGFDDDHKAIQFQQLVTNRQ